MTRAPIVICGCHGGGTSFVAKMLRNSGLFMGIDAGPVSARKHHESRCFRITNMQFLHKLGDKDGMDEIAVNRAIVTYSELHKCREVARTVDLCGLLKTFFGTYPHDQAWGWKDPRNSLTFPVWKELFPQAKVVIISKMVDEKQSKSSSGQWFRQISTSSLRDAYMNPWWKKHHSETMVISFEEVTSSPATYNELLRFCQLPEIDVNAFQGLLLDCSYES
jgi:hypothetical protein